VTRRLRSVSQRMEGIEEAIDRVDERLEAIGRAPATAIDERLGAIEGQLVRLGTELAHLAASLDAGPAPVPREQERLEVESGGDAAKPKPKRSGRAKKG
jgi:hypothetical protein